MRGAGLLMAAIVAAPLMAPPALSQWLGDSPMPPQAIARILMRQGFTGFSPPRLTGDVYIVQAVTEDGERVRVVIDALDGRILRPVRVIEESAPGRSIDRLLPRDRGPLPEYEVESIERFRAPRTGRDEVLLPPRPIGRPGPFEGRRPRDTEYEGEREPVEPYRAPPAGREPPLPTVRNEPAPNGRAARVEQPAPERLAPAPREVERPREASRPRPAPAPTVAAPTVPTPTVAAPKPDRPADLKPIEVKPTEAKLTEPRPADIKPAETKPATTAAVPTAPAPAPTAPASAPRGQKPEASATAAAPAPQAPAAAQPASAQPPTGASASPPKVRVIEGVTPVLPQDPASAEKK